MKPCTRLPSRLKAEAGEPAEDDCAYPDDDEDAVLEVAHPAGEQHLADISDDGGEDAHGEGDERDPLRHGAIVGTGEHEIERGGSRTDPVAQPAGKRSLGESDETDPHGLSTAQKPNHCRNDTNFMKA